MLDALMRPLPPDWRLNIQRAFGGFAEAVGSPFPLQTSEVLQMTGKMLPIMSCIMSYIFKESSIYECRVKLKLVAEAFELLMV